MHPTARARWFPASSAGLGCRRSTAAAAAAPLLAVVPRRGGAPSQIAPRRVALVRGGVVSVSAGGGWQTAPSGTTRRPPTIVVAAGAGDASQQFGEPRANADAADVWWWAVRRTALCVGGAIAIAALVYCLGAGKAVVSEPRAQYLSSSKRPLKHSWGI